MIQFKHLYHLLCFFRFRTIPVLKRLYGKEASRGVCRLKTRTAEQVPRFGPEEKHTFGADAARNAAGQAKATCYPILLYKKRRPKSMTQGPAGGTAITRIPVKNKRSGRREQYSFPVVRERKTRSVMHTQNSGIPRVIQTKATGRSADLSVAFISRLLFRISLPEGSGQKRLRRYAEAPRRLT